MTTENRGNYFFGDSLWEKYLSRARNKFKEVELSHPYSVTHGIDEPAFK